VRIVAVHTRHTVTADDFAFTEAQFFNLADAAAPHVVAGVDEVGNVVCNPLAWLVVVNLPSSVLDSGIAFEVTTDANRIPPLRVKLDRIDYRSFPRTHEVGSGVAMTPLASDAPVKKR
jgi:hypothetical protein